MTAYLHVKILSPTSLVFDGEAKAILLSAADGQMEALPQHAEYAAVLKSGALDVTLANNEKKRFNLTAPGLLQITHNQVTVFVDQLAS